MKSILRHNPISALVRRLVNAELRAMLEDVDYRIKLLDDGNRIGSHQLTLKHHILDGFTFTDNSPEAHEVAWTGCHIVYEGTDYTITDGHAATAEDGVVYIWWDKSVSTTTFQTTAKDTKPTVTDEDCLVCINADGIHKLVIGQGRMQHAAFLLGTSINSGELASGAVIEAVLGTGAVTVDKIGASAVTEGKIGTGAVTVDKIGSSAVVEAKIGASAVTVDKIGASAVTEGKIGTGAVVEAKIGTGAVVEGKIGAGAVVEGKLGDLAVTAAKIDNLTITGAKVAAGTLASAKLNLIAHLLY